MEPDLYFEEATVEADALVVLEAYAQTYEDLELKIFQLENDLKDATEKLRKLSQSNIPQLLNDNGLSEVRLKNGKKIIVSDVVKASINKGNVDSAYVSMRTLEETEDAAQAIDNLFKSSLHVKDLSNETQKLLLENGIAYDIERSIHYQTLGKYVRSKLEAGQTVPEEISVFQFQETKIK
jgi:hypothetical protein